MSNTSAPSAPRAPHGINVLVSLRANTDGSDFSILVESAFVRSHVTEPCHSQPSIVRALKIALDSVEQSAPLIPPPVAPHVATATADVLDLLRARNGHPR